MSSDYAYKQVAHLANNIGPRLSGSAQAAKAVQASAFGCAGERCMAGSLALPVGGIADRLVERLVDLAGQMRVGPTDSGSEVDMGPVISRDHRDRVAVET